MSPITELWNSKENTKTTGSNNQLSAYTCFAVKGMQITLKMDAVVKQLTFTFTFPLAALIV